MNYIISECSKLAQKEYKTRHDWLCKVIHWELWKKLKFDHTNKWYMHYPESVLLNETHELLWDFDMQTDQLISARRPDLKIINNNNNKKLANCGLCCPGWPHRIKLKENEKKDEYLDLVRELKKNCGTWKWQLYQLWLVLLVQSPKDY